MISKFKPSYKIKRTDEKITSRAGLIPFGDFLKAMNLIHLAVQFANLISLMITRGARVDAVNKAGDTPLHCIESMAPITSYLLRLYGADIYKKNNEGLTPYEKAVCYCRNVEMLDGRLLNILEPPRSHRLIGWFSGEQPKVTHLASAESYGITLANLPGIQAEDTRSFDIVASGKDSRIERVDDNDGQAVAAVQMPEGAERAQEPQPKENAFSGVACICEQIGTKCLGQVAAFFCPRERIAEQSHDRTQAVLSPGPEAVAMKGEASALPKSASPQGHPALLVRSDDPDGVTQGSTRHRFFVHGQPS